MKALLYVINRSLKTFNIQMNAMNGMNDYVNDLDDFSVDVNDLDDYLNSRL